MLRTYLIAYPWDVDTDGVDAVLDRMQGELGVTGLSLWVGTPPVQQLRAGDVSPRIFHTQGGLFFQPSEKLYEATRCKPLLSSWLKGRNPAARVAEACAKRGLAIRGRLPAAETGRFPQRYAEMTCKNALDCTSSRSLCLADSDVQEYLCSVVTDLSESYGFEGIVLTDFGIGWPDAFRGGVRTPRQLSDVEQILLSVCFRECCLQKAAAAEVDARAALQFTRDFLRQSLSSPAVSDRSFESVVAEAPPLAAYLRWQSAELGALLTRMSEACRCELVVERASQGLSAVQQRELDWSPAAAVNWRAGDDHPPSTPGTRAELVIGHEQLVGRPAGEVVSRFTELAQGELQVVEIADFGLLPEETLTVIKQAIRYARRSTVG